MIQLTVLGFGSNLGQRFSNIRRAVALISESANFNLLGISPVYETEPWGPVRKQGKFLNCAAAGFYRADCGRLYREIKLIEKKLGRVRARRWHPRVIDIDILFFGKKRIKKGSVEIPHPRIQFRNFVLKPLADLMPDFVHPVLKESMQRLYEKSKDRGEVKLFKKLI